MRASLALLALLVPLAGGAAQDAELDRRTAALAHELRCLVCQNQTIADSNAPLAVDLRQQIREQLARGASEREVREFMVARYGDFVLYRPPLKASTVALWAGPFLLLVAGVLLLWRRLARRREPPVPLTEAERARGAAARMSVFWAIGAALGALVLFLLLRPLLARGGAAPVSRREANIALYRDQLRELDADLAAGKLARADHERARAELEARLLDDVEQAPEAAPARRGGRGMALAVGVAVPLCALAVYLAVGSPGALDPRAAPGAVTEAQIAQMVEGLAARLRENPDDVDGWRMLGRSYMVLGRYGEAVDAYAKAALRAPRDAQLLVDFADALAMARGQSLRGEPEKLVQRALEIDPRNLKALALAGTAAFERGDYTQAAAYWERMLPGVPADSADAGVIRENVAEARKRAAAPAAGVRGTARVAPGLQGKYGAGDTVFIYVRAVDGPPMPLAILRRKAGELPLEFALDDSMAMAPGMALSAHPRVVVTARISRSGDATPQPGDLQGASAPVANDAAGVEVVIDAEVR